MTDRTFDPTQNPLTDKAATDAPAAEGAAVEDALIEEATDRQVEIDRETTITRDETRVVIHNDDVTPYDYVMYMLADLFMLSEEIADHIAWSAHTKGSAIVVIRPRREAEKLVLVAHGRAKVDGYPLRFTLE